MAEVKQDTSIQWYEKGSYGKHLEDLSPAARDKADAAVRNLVVGTSAKVTYEVKMFDVRNNHYKSRMVDFWAYKQKGEDGDYIEFKEGFLVRNSVMALELTGCYTNKTCLEASNFKPLSFNETKLLSFKADCFIVIDCSEKKDDVTKFVKQRNGSYELSTYLEKDLHSINVESQDTSIVSLGSKDSTEEHEPGKKHKMEDYSGRAREARAFAFEIKSEGHYKIILKFKADESKSICIKKI